MLKMNPATRQPFFVYRCLKRVEHVLDSAGVRGEPVVVAVSGGSDSMALLELVSMLSPKLELELHVVCVDHAMRPESATELEMVRDASRARGAAFHTATIDPGDGDEDTLRRQRYGVLAQVAATTRSRFILVGHTSDDQIETIVFRFLRGAGLAGLAGMHERRGSLLRPLLSLRREDLRRVLRSRHVEFVEDPSNLSDRYARGRLRTVVLPAIVRAFGRGALDHLLDVAVRWRSDDEYLEQEAGRLLVQASRPPADQDWQGAGESGQRRVEARRLEVGEVELDTSVLGEAHPSLRSRVLRRWLTDRTGNVPGSRELQAVERWLDEPRPSSSVDIAGTRLIKRRGRLRFDNPCPIRVLPTASVDVRRRSAAYGDIGSESGKDAVLPPSDSRVRFPRT